MKPTPCHFCGFRLTRFQSVRRGPCLDCAPHLPDSPAFVVCGACLGEHRLRHDQRRITNTPGEVPATHGPRPPRYRETCLSEFA